MRKLKGLVLSAAVALCAESCGYSASYRTSGPSLSSQGVQVGVAGVLCHVKREQDPFPDVIDQEQVDLAVRLQVRNGASQVADLSEGHIRLTEADAARGTAAPEQSGVFSVDPGETRQVALHFETSSITNCHQPFELELADSVDVAGSPVALNPIAFAATP